MKSRVEGCPTVVCVAYNHFREDFTQRENGQNEEDLMERGTHQVMTDKISLYIFGAALALWMAVAIYGHVHSSMQNSTIDVQPQLNITPNAGHNKLHAERKYIFGSNFNQVPNISNEDLDLQYFYEIENKGNRKTDPNEELREKDWVYQNKGNENDSNKTEVPDTKKELILVIEHVGEDISEARYVIEGSLVVTAIISMLYLYFLYWTAEITVWSSFILFGLTILYGLVYCIMTLCGTNIPRIIPSAPEEWFNFSASTQWIILTAVLTIILTVYVVLLYKKQFMVKQGIPLIKESSRVIRSKCVPALIAASTWPLHVLILLFMLKVLANVHRVRSTPFFAKGLDESCGCTGIYRDTIVGIDCESNFIQVLCKNCTYVCQENTAYPGEDIIIKILQGYNVFLYLWVTIFLKHLSYTIIAGSFAYTYFKKEENASILLNLFRPIYKIFRYHLGTLAVGSLISLCTLFIKIVKLFIFHSTAKHVMDSVFGRHKRKLRKKIQNPWAKILTSSGLLQTCRHSYVTTLTFGTSFKESALTVLKVRKEKLLRLCMMIKFILFLSQLALSLAVTLRCIRIIRDIGVKQYFSGLAPGAFIFVSSMIVSGILFSICEIAAETIIIAFLEDQNINNEGDQKLFQIPNKLVKSLSINNNKKGNKKDHKSNSAVTQDS